MKLTNILCSGKQNRLSSSAILYYNFVRIHKTLKVTPAMEAGVTERLWNLEDIVKLLEEKEAGDVKQTH